MATGRSHAAVMAPKPCTYGQLIVLGGLLETGRRVVRGGGNSLMRRGGFRGNEGIPVYISLRMCTKFSQNKKEKKYASQNKHWAWRSLWAMYLWRTENQAGWHFRVIDYRGNQIIPGTTCDFEPTLWGLQLGSGVSRLCVWHMGV